MGLLTDGVGGGGPAYETDEMVVVVVSSTSTCRSHTSLLLFLCRAENGLAIK